MKSKGALASDDEVVVDLRCNKSRHWNLDITYRSWALGFGRFGV